MTSSSSYCRIEALRSAKLRSAETIQEKVKDGADGGVDERGDGEMDGEEGLRVGEQEPLNEYDDALVDREKNNRESEARGRMLGIKLAADGRGNIADQSFRNP